VLLCGCEQVVAPGDGFTHRPLALRQIPGTSTQEQEPLREALQQHREGKHPDVCCRQFDGQRQSVQLVTNGCHRRRGVIQTGLYALRSLAKEGHGSGLR
jgi:hypothetical protein